MFDFFMIKVFLIMVVSALPFFLILNEFKFKLFEKFIYSLFISLAFFPYVIYWANIFYVDSYRISLLISYCFLFAVYFMLIFYKFERGKLSWLKLSNKENGKE